jgi:hypothetical protein
MGSAGGGVRTEGEALLKVHRLGLSNMVSQDGSMCSAERHHCRRQW